MNPLIQYIRNHHHLSPETLDAFTEVLKHSTLSKGDFLHKQGLVAHRLYFVVSGAIRGYYLSDGKEITHWLAFESDIVTSFHSFITRKPSIENLQALEPTEFWSVSYDDLYRLYDLYPDLERFGRITCEQYYVRLENRYVNNQFKTAAEKYQLLLDERPHILQRVSLGHIASYLGVSQETLSRIRAKHC